jgi:hypothetical protein
VEKWSELCDLVCNEPYNRCKHKCQHPCHAHIYYMHPKCMFLLERDCDLHRDIKIQCNTFQRNNINLKGEFEFKCDILIGEWTRPDCGHIFKNEPCHRIKHYQIENRCYKKTKKFTRECGYKVRTYCTPAINAKSPSDGHCLIKALRPRPRCEHDILLPKLPIIGFVHCMRSNILSRIVNYSANIWTQVW